MEGIEEILKRLMKTPSTGRPTEANKCSICKDTGWEYIADRNTYTQCKCVKLRHIESLWSAYGIDRERVKLLMEYKPYDAITSKAKERALEYVKAYSSIKDTEQNCLCLLGQAGAGKTHLVMGIGAELIEQGVNVVYMPYVDILQRLSSTYYDKEAYQKLVNQFIRAEVLIIDDLFKNKLRNGALLQGASVGEQDMKHLYPIINHRYNNNKPMLISSEATPEILMELDEALTGRMLQRAKNYLVILKGKKYNYRMREFING